VRLERGSRINRTAALPVGLIRPPPAKEPRGAERSLRWTPREPPRRWTAFAITEVSDRGPLRTQREPGEVSVVYHDKLLARLYHPSRSDKLYLMTSEAPPPDSQPKAKRPRSPSYPGIGLEEALERARTLYQHQRNHAANVDVVLQHWGYKPKSGAGGVVLAALKKFGLLVDEGSGDGRTARLTDLALDILLDAREDSAAREEAIRRAALTPSIHRELLEQNDGILPPSDAGLLFHLTRERGFTEGAARELIRELRGTLAFAQLADGNYVSRQEPDKPAAAPTEVDSHKSSTTAAAGVPAGARGSGPATERLSADSSSSVADRAYRLPLVSTEVVIQGEFPISEADWEQLRRLLDVMKPGLTRVTGGDQEDTAR
jgi:hypothetical protein